MGVDVRRSFAGFAIRYRGEKIGSAVSGYLGGGGEWFFPGRNPNFAGGHRLKKEFADDMFSSELLFKADQAMCRAKAVMGSSLRE